LDGSLIFILLVGVFLTNKLINVFKLHITYPRTGYVEYYPSKNEEFSAKVFIFLSIAVFVFLLIGLGRWVGSFQWLPGFIGLITSVVLIVIRMRTAELNRFYFLAGASFIFGMIATFSNLPPQYSISLFYVLFSLMLIAIGFITLAKYLRENPLPVEGSDE